MALNAKNCQFIKIFGNLKKSDKTLVDEDTKKAFIKTVEKYFSPIYAVKLRYLIFPQFVIYSATMENSEITVSQNNFGWKLFNC